MSFKLVPPIVISLASLPVALTFGTLQQLLPSRPQHTYSVNNSHPFEFIAVVWLNRLKLVKRFKKTSRQNTLGLSQAKQDLSNPPSIMHPAAYLVVLSPAPRVKRSLSRTALA
ncbi:hypothetical protein B0H13DRAFT_1904946 [Mycena leptocephala]|nr:hypothetical protein B0H13DRAFT_1904946 [Mycena leptocephala]